MGIQHRMKAVIDIFFLCITVPLYPYFELNIEQDAVRKLLFIKEDTETIE